MRLKKNRALTLTELIIATVIIGIIMVGIGSMDFALRQSHQGSSRNALIAMRTSAIMLHITKNAQLATGNLTDLGLITTATNAWIRLDNPNNPTPDNYSDDTWVSYTFDTLNQDLYFCTVLDNATACTSADETLGTLENFTPTLTIDTTPGNPQLYLEISLSSLFDLSQPEDPFSNPRYTLTTRVYPKSISNS